MSVRGPGDVLRESACPDGQHRALRYDCNYTIVSYRVPDLSVESTHVSQIAGWPW